METKNGKCLVTDLEIIEAITMVLPELDPEDLIKSAEKYLGGKYKVSPDNDGRPSWEEWVFEFEHDENYGGAFDYE